MEIETGTTLLRAVSKKRVCWPQTCGGKAQCASCAYVVVQGSENLSPMNRYEQKLLMAGRGPVTANRNVRLACQSTVNGDVTVHKKLIGS